MTRHILLCRYNFGSSRGRFTYLLGTKSTIKQQIHSQSIQSCLLHNYKPRVMIVENSFITHRAMCPICSQVFMNTW